MNNSNLLNFDNDQSEISKNIESNENRESGGEDQGNSNTIQMTCCSNCGTTTTPLWRRGPDGRELCNACALYLKTRKQHRPNSFPKGGREQPKAALNIPNAGTCPGNGKCNGTGGQTSCAGCPAFNQNLQRVDARECAHCRATSTPLWRKDKDLKTLCNACWLYEKLNGRKRPLNLKKEGLIKRRNRPVNNKNQSSFSSAITTSEEKERDQSVHTASDSDDIRPLPHSTIHRNTIQSQQMTSTEPVNEYDFHMPNPSLSSLSNQDKEIINRDKEYRSLLNSDNYNSHEMNTTNSPYSQHTRNSPYASSANISSPGIAFRSSTPPAITRLPPLSEFDARLRRFEHRTQSESFSSNQLNVHKDELTKQLEELKKMLNNTTQVINEIDKKLNRQF